MGPDINLPAPKTIAPRLPGCDWRADLRANYLAGDHKFHAPVLLPALRSVIRSHWLSFAEPRCRNGTDRHSLLCQVIAYSGATLLRQPLIVVIGADAVGVTF